jgi:hypothetical protein
MYRSRIGAGRQIIMGILPESNHITFCSKEHHIRGLPLRITIESAKIKDSPQPSAESNLMREQLNPRDLVVYYIDGKQYRNRIYARSNYCQVSIFVIDQSVERSDGLTNSINCRHHENPPRLNVARVGLSPDLKRQRSGGLER